MATFKRDFVSQISRTLTNYYCTMLQWAIGSFEWHTGTEIAIFLAILLHDNFPFFWLIWGREQGWDWNKYFFHMQNSELLPLLFYVLCLVNSSSNFKDEKLKLESSSWLLQSKCFGLCTPPYLYWAERFGYNKDYMIRLHFHQAFIPKMCWKTKFGGMYLPNPSTPAGSYKGQFFLPSYGWFEFRVYILLHWLPNQS